MKRIWLVFLFPLVLSAVPSLAGWAAEDVYQTPEEFIAESFGGLPPAPRTLAVEGELKDKVADVMTSYYRLPRVRYWEKDGRTAWILEEIGKFEPITAGFAVGPDGTLERVKVLIYRESHGWEVKHDFFTRQFEGAGLKKGKKLDRRIDGISGATLSVNALKRLGTLALLLHQEVQKRHED